MARRSHVFYTKGEEGEVRLRQRPRKQGEEDEDDPTVDETLNNDPKREDFAASLNRFAGGLAQRVAARNPALQLPTHVDCIRIRFHNSFDVSVFESRYRNNFGLSAISYTDFNTVGVFAIVDQELFDLFLSNVQLFIDTPDDADAPSYHRDILYIHSFSCFTTADMLQFPDLRSTVVMDLFSNVDIYRDRFLPIYEHLQRYLQERRIVYFPDLLNNRLELQDATAETLQEIANNFDIIHSVNSFPAGVVRPGAFNMPERTFGFEVSNAGDDLPVIGIIDTGIAENTPLDGLVINEDNAFDITNTSARIDLENHGTAVAALAALGERLYPNHSGNFQSDARLLSMKIIHRSPGAVIEKQVLDLIREAHRRYGTRIFTVTVGYITHKLFNETHSNYAYSLDQLVHELDILIVISVGNMLDFWDASQNNNVLKKYPDLFDMEEHNLNAPAESMNSLTVGSASWNMEEIAGSSLSPARNYPASYSRTHHINWSHPSVTKHRINKRLFKPDLLCFTGDLTTQIGMEPYGLKTLSVNPGEFFRREVGTSYAAPLIANLAARLMRLYPDIRHMQTIKAMLINGCDCPNIESDFKALSNTRLKGIQGNGIVAPERILYSDDDRVTFVLESDIEPDKIRSYELIVPDYLLDINRKLGVLHVEATLCFSFVPVAHNQLAYCPLHISFGIFRNLALEASEQQEKTNQNGETVMKSVSTGINNNTVEKIGAGESWSQDYYYRHKLLSNAQKISFNLQKQVLRDENCRLKISLQCKLHRLLPAYQQALYPGPHPFSLVISLSEIPVAKQTTPYLYEQVVDLNDLQIIADGDAIAEVE